MKTETYIKNFNDYDNAYGWMVTKNLCNRNKNEFYAVIPGPEDNYCVVDSITAIELGLGYVVSHSHTGCVSNPFIS